LQTGLCSAATSSSSSSCGGGVCGCFHPTGKEIRSLVFVVGLAYYLPKAKDIVFKFIIEYILASGICAPR
jgi:hypothetical protein